MELEEKHLRNLRTVPNRDKMLEFFPKGSTIAEIGVDKGDFSKKILSITKPKVLHLIDSWDSARYSKYELKMVRIRFDEEIASNRVVLHIGESTEELIKFKDGYFDWIYIDTSHEYEQTVKELELSRLKVRDGGIISGHDYCQGNIEKRLKYGVAGAVNNFCVNYDWEIIYLTLDQDLHFSFAIRKIV